MFHAEQRDSHEISSLMFSGNNEKVHVFMNVVCCSLDWRLKVYRVIILGWRTLRCRKDEQNAVDLYLYSRHTNCGLNHSPLLPFI